MELIKKVKIMLMTILISLSFNQVQANGGVDLGSSLSQDSRFIQKPLREFGNILTGNVRVILSVGLILGAFIAIPFNVTVAIAMLVGGVGTAMSARWSIDMINSVGAGGIFQ